MIDRRAKASAGGGLLAFGALMILIGVTKAETVTQMGIVSLLSGASWTTAFALLYDAFRGGDGP